jgi:Uma2 family endonuclease
VGRKRNFGPKHDHFCILTSYFSPTFCILPFYFLLFPAYFLRVPITIELPDLQTQTRFNLARWGEVLADPVLAKLPNRIETDRHGYILMSPPPAYRHSRRQGRIMRLLTKLLPDGETSPECPVSTADGVRVMDVAWLAPSRSEINEDPVLLLQAPEICVEIISPSNSAEAIAEKRALFFDAGAAEVWICNLDGSITFFAPPDHRLDHSLLCPDFPNRIQ